MSVVAEAERIVLGLPDVERARLADRLWKSLPEDFIDEAELDEAVERGRELDEDPSKRISQKEFFDFFKERSK